MCGLYEWETKTTEGNGKVENWGNGQWAVCMSVDRLGRVAGGGGGCEPK